MHMDINAAKSASSGPAPRLNYMAGAVPASKTILISKDDTV